MRNAFCWAFDSLRCTSSRSAVRLDTSNDAVAGGGTQKFERSAKGQLVPQPTRRGRLYRLDPRDSDGRSAYLKDSGIQMALRWKSSFLVRYDQRFSNVRCLTRAIGEAG